MPRHPPDALQTLDLNSNENACATRRNKPARELINRTSCFSPFDATPSQACGPAEERPRSLALHLHLSMIPPQLLSSEAPKRALCARFGPRFRVVVPSNGPRNRAADHPRSTPDVLLGNWWRQTGSNRRPPACKAGALPTELCPRSAIRTTAKHGGPGRI